MKAWGVFALAAWVALAAPAVCAVAPTATATPSIPGASPLVSVSFALGSGGVLLWDELAGTEYGGQPLVVKIQNDSDYVFRVATTDGDVFEIQPHSNIYRYDLTGDTELRVLFSPKTCTVSLEWHR